MLRAVCERGAGEVLQPRRTAKPARRPAAAGGIRVPCTECGVRNTAAMPANEPFTMAVTVVELGRRGLRGGLPAVAGTVILAATQLSCVIEPGRCAVH